MDTALRAPFPWFGGKSRAAHLIWERFGDVANYIEPFAGSLAVLLSRPTAPRIETVNDLDCYLSNFWRSVQVAPDEVAKWADWPVNEADLHARHRWLRTQEEFRVRMHEDPDYYDAKIAGWWVWGLSQWIGSGWCSLSGSAAEQKPHLGNSGRGVHRAAQVKEIDSLSERLRRVRVCCGDWARVLTTSVLRAGIPCAVLLDPPYPVGDFSYLPGCADKLYRDVVTWCRQHENEPGLRIALCGYDGTVSMPDSWEVIEWRYSGGYGNQGNNNNKSRERIWFSPHCLKGTQPRLL